MIIELEMCCEDCMGYQWKARVIKTDHELTLILTCLRCLGEADFSLIKMPEGQHVAGDVTKSGGNA